MTNPDQIPTWPRIHALVRDNGSAEVTLNGTSHPVEADSIEAARAQVLELVRTKAAAELQRPVRVDTTGPDGDWQLIVHPDGEVAEAPGQAQTRPRAAERPTAAEAAPPADEPPAIPEPAPAAAPIATPVGTAAAAVPTLDDLLATRPAPPIGPATTGWQVTLRRLTGGLINPGPGKAELAHRQAVAAVQRSLNGPKTIVVVNPKGGAHKTTATLLLAATFGIHRGGYTLAWDNNETRGTLGWRANQARHTNTAVDLLTDLERFTEVRSSRVGDLDNYVRSQGSAQFDVLASDEDADSSASIDAAAFARLHRTLQRFYRVLVIDTGNNMRASNWQAAVAAADQLVIVSTVREDTAQSAAWLIDGLRATGHADKVTHAVTILTAPARVVDQNLSQRLHHHFSQLTRAVVDVPHDPTLVGGGPITYEALTDTSRAAWLKATAAVSEGL